MRVVIVGGRSRADYLMGALAETVDTVVAINDDAASASTSPAAMTAR